MPISSHLKRTSFCHRLGLQGAAFPNAHVTQRDSHTSYKWKHTCFVHHRNSWMMLCYTCPLRPGQVACMASAWIKLNTNSLALTRLYEYIREGRMSNFIIRQLHRVAYVHCAQQHCGPTIRHLTNLSNTHRFVALGGCYGWFFGAVLAKAIGLRFPAD